MDDSMDEQAMEDRCVIISTISKTLRRVITSIRIMIVITIPMIVGIHTGRETAETAMVIVKGDGIIRVC